MEAFRREMIRRDDLEGWRRDSRLAGQSLRKLELSPNDFHEALKLRLDGKSWANIADLKHPSFSRKAMAEAFRRHAKQHQTEGAEMIECKRKSSNSPMMHMSVFQRCGKKKYPRIF